VTGPLALALAVLAGVFVAIQAAALAPLTRVVPPVVAAFWAQVLGVMTAAALVLVSRTQLAWPGSAWPWALVAGSCTIVIIASVGAAVTPLGLAVAVGTVTAAQLVTGLLLDTAGATGRAVPLTPARVLGAVLIVAGAALLFARTETTTP
jgi:bacterial/archaeal transporter family-2 protein